MPLSQRSLSREALWDLSAGALQFSFADLSVKAAVAEAHFGPAAREAFLSDSPANPGGFGSECVSPNTAAAATASATPSSPPAAPGTPSPAPKMTFDRSYVKMIGGGGGPVGDADAAEPMVGTGDCGHLREPSKRESTSSQPISGAAIPEGSPVGGTGGAEAAGEDTPPKVDGGAEGESAWPPLPGPSPKPRSRARGLPPARSPSASGDWRSLQDPSNTRKAWPPTARRVSWNNNVVDAPEPALKPPPEDTALATAHEDLLRATRLTDLKRTEIYQLEAAIDMTRADIRQAVAEEPPTGGPRAEELYEELQVQISADADTSPLQAASLSPPPTLFS